VANGAVVIPCSNCLVCTTPADDNCSPGEHPHCDGCEHCFFMHVPSMVRMTATTEDDTDETV
jgi:hypothetical protein